MLTIPDNTPSAISTVTPRRQRRQPRITYLSQSLLTVAIVGAANSFRGIDSAKTLSDWLDRNMILYNK
jgi:hypothetical protein